MNDVQMKLDKRGLRINEVGIKNFIIPTKVQVGESYQSTVSNVSCSIDLDKNYKGIHMSRLTNSLLNDWNGEINYLTINLLMERIKKICNCSNVNLIIKSTIFLDKVSPVSKIKNLINYEIVHYCTLSDNNFHIELELKVPFTSLCPCSKEISLYGAHNQRGLTNIKLQISNQLDYKKIISDVEECASSELYSILKREDEKYVTEKAYNNPKFVEDMVRDIYKKLQKFKGVEILDIYVEHFESIHNHNAFAKIINEGRDTKCQN